METTLELKYLLWDREILPFLSRLGPLLTDPRVRRGQGRVTTVYLDRPDGLLARRALACPDRRLEVRLRECFSPEGMPTSTCLWVETKEVEGRRSAIRRFQLPKRQVPRFLEAGLVPAGAVSFRRLALEAADCRLILDQEISYHLGPFDLFALDRDRLGPAALEETAAVIEVQTRSDRPPKWCANRTGSAGPVDYSKFLILAALARSERRVSSSG